MIGLRGLTWLIFELGLWYIGGSLLSTGDYAGSRVQQGDE